MTPRPVDPDVRLLAALADPVRLDMLRELSGAGVVCGCGFRVLDRVAQPTVSHHLRVLREAGLVRFERERSYLMYRIDPAALARVSAIVDGLRSGTAERGAPSGPCCGTARSA